MGTIDVIYYAVIFVWLSYLPVAVIQFRGWLGNRKEYVRTDLARIKNDPKITFQIMTRSASRSDVVKRGIEAVHSSCKEIDYDEYSVCVVTEDPADRTLENAEVIVVPKGYRTKNNAIRKARALQYAVELRNAKGSATGDWIYHLDEESVVTSQTVLALLAFIREKKGLIAEGPITYPLKMEKANRLSMLAESIRPFQCYDCVSQMHNSPPVYMHGSNLLVRQDVEDSIGWDNGETVAEDQLFGIKVYQKYGDVFGWHGGVLLEQPPLNLRDHFKQRRRWVTGTLQNLKYLPTKEKLRVYFRASTFWLGFVSAVATIGMYLYYVSPYVAYTLAGIFGVNYDIPKTASMPIATPNSVVQTFQTSGTFTITPQGVLSGLIGASLLTTLIVWVLSYQVGLHQNLKYAKVSPSKALGLHLQQLVLGPLIGIIETFPAFYTMIEYNISRRSMRDFELIAK